MMAALKESRTPMNSTLLKTVLIALPFLACSCQSDQGPAQPLEGEPAAAGLPGEGIDPAFEGTEFPYDGNEDPGAGFPGGSP